MSVIDNPAPALRAWKVGGMDCTSCAAKISGAVERMPGVTDVKVSIISETLSLLLDEGKTPAARLEAQVQALGYTTERIEPKRPTAAPKRMAR